MCNSETSCWSTGFWNGGGEDQVAYPINKYNLAKDKNTEFKKGGTKQNFRDNKNISGFQGFGGRKGGVNR